MASHTESSQDEQETRQNGSGELSRVWQWTFGPSDCVPEMWRSDKETAQNPSFYLGHFGGTCHVCRRLCSTGRPGSELPPLPVNVKFRPSLLGPRAGYVLVIENTSSSPLPVIANLTHTSVNDGRRYDLYIPAGSQTDISKLVNGWTTEHGDRVTLENANYKPWSGSVP